MEPLSIHESCAPSTVTSIDRIRSNMRSVRVCGVAGIDGRYHEEPLTDIVATITVGVHVFPRFLRAQVVVVRHPVTVAVVNASISVAVKLRRRPFVHGHPSTKLGTPSSCPRRPGIRPGLHRVEGKRRLRRTHRTC